MKNSALISLVLSGILVLGLTAPLAAAGPGIFPFAEVSAPVSIPQLNIPAPKPRMSSDLALQTYELRLQQQVRELGEYNDITVIDAELPSTAQKGRFRVQRMFSAPKSLAFKAIDFVGDGFVKTNVIARLMQSEVDHVQKDDAQTTSISAMNYKFNYKGVEDLGGKPVHVYQVKPRKKRVGLFKGKIYLDAYSGSIIRAEGRMVKSPSIFIKKVDFVQEYTEVAGFNFVTRIHSTAETRVIGKAVVNITHSDYQARTIAELQAPAQPTPSVRVVSFSGGN